MDTPVNWIAPGKSVLNASTMYGNIGARDNGAMPWKKDTAVATPMAADFQKGFQFYESVLARQLIEYSQKSQGHQRITGVG